MKLMLFCSFIFSSIWLFSQEKAQPYLVHAESAGFSKINRLDQINPMYFDLYRSKSVDNTVIVRIEGQEIGITLLSANQLKSIGQPYNEALVEKGAIMSGEAANYPRTFIWNVGEANKVEDLTTY